MSVWSMIRKGRAQAKATEQKHADTKAQDVHVEKTPVPYRHIPTHAAADALNGAPQSMKNEDRTRIAAYNRRRYSLPLPTTSSLYHGISPGAVAMITQDSGNGSSVTDGGNRTSRMSYVSYPSANASPHVSSPRPYNYSGGHPQSWHDRMGEILYADSGAPLPVPVSLKGGNGEARGKDKDVDYCVSVGAGTGLGEKRLSSNVSSLPPIIPLSSLSSDFKALPQLVPPSPLLAYNNTATTTTTNNNNNAVTNSFTSSIDTYSDDSLAGRQQTTSPTPAGHHRRSSSGTHRLHPAGRSRANSASGAASPSPSPLPNYDPSRPPPFQYDPPPTLASAIYSPPIIPDTAASAFVFSSNVSSRPASRPRTAGADSKRRPPVSLSGAKVQAIAGVSVSNSYIDGPHERPPTGRSPKATRFKEMDDNYIAHGPSTIHHALQHLPSPTTDSPSPSTPDILWSHASSSTVTASKPQATSYPPLATRSRGMYRRFTNEPSSANGSTASVQSTAQRPPSRQSNASMSSVTKIKGFFSRRKEWRASVAA